MDKQRTIPAVLAVFTLTAIVLLGAKTTFAAAAVGDARREADAHFHYRAWTPLEEKQAEQAGEKVLQECEALTGRGPYGRFDSISSQGMARAPMTEVARLSRGHSCTEVAADIGTRPYKNYLAARDTAKALAADNAGNRAFSASMWNFGL